MKLSSYFRYPNPETATARKNVGKALDMAKGWAATDKLKVESYPVIVDAGGTNLNYGLDECPCLTKSRCQSRLFWSLQHGRFLTIFEMGRLQGFYVSSMRVSISPAAMGSLIGNAFSVPVWRAVFAAAMSSAEGSWRSKTNASWLTNMRSFPRRRMHVNVMPVCSRMRRVQRLQNFTATAFDTGHSLFIVFCGFC